MNTTLTYGTLYKLLGIALLGTALLGASAGCSDSDSADDGGDSSDSGVTGAQIYDDLAYAATSDRQVLDLYIPDGAGPFPVVVLIHGGGFAMGRMQSHADHAQFLADSGIAAATINYRLSGEAIFPAAVHDSKAAVRFLRANADTYNLDPARVGAWGDSAGGNLAAMLGTSAGDQFTEDLSLGNEAFSSAVLATVVWFPPVDFTTIEAEAEALGFIATTDLEDAYMGFPVEDDPEATARANPTTYIDADDGAFLVQVGSADPLIPYTQSENFAAALSAELGADRVTFELLEGASHGGGEFESDDNLAQVLAFFNDHL